MKKLAAIGLFLVCISCNAVKRAQVTSSCNYVCTIKNQTFNYTINFNGNYHLFPTKDASEMSLYKTVTNSLDSYSPKHKRKYFDFYCTQKTSDAYQIIAETFELKEDSSIQTNTVKYLFKEYQEIDKKSILARVGSFWFKDSFYNYVSISLFDNVLLHRFTFFGKNSQHTTNDLYNEAVSQIVSFKTTKNDIEHITQQKNDTGFFQGYNYYSKITAIKSVTNQDNEDINNTLISNYYSFLGMDDSAKYYNEKRYEKYRNPNNENLLKNSNLDKDYIKYTLPNFVDLNRISQSKILILNEAHHLNVNRDIARLLLPLLKEKGYNYFAVEGILNPQTIDSVKMPTFFSGYYFQSRNYINLVDEAIKLGFKIIAYDDTTDINWKTREFNQAQNLYTKTFAVDSNAKVFVYCGYDHGRKDTATNKYFAHYLQKITRKATVSVRQTLHYNHHFERYNSKRYWSLNTQDKDEFPYVIEDKNDKFDFDVVIPNTSLKIFNTDTIVNLKNKLENVPYNYLLVFSYDEFNVLGNAAVPTVNQSKLTFIERNYQLRIPPQKSIVFLLDDKFNEVGRFFVMDN